MSVKIEKLRSDNFDTWKIQVEALLIRNDTWNYVCGKKKKPAKVEGDAANDVLVEKWEDADQKAKSDLILSISPSELRQIKGCSTSNEIWRKLHDIYQSRGPARKATLLKQLLFSKMKDDEPIKDYLRSFAENVDKLLEMNLDINEDILVIILLYSLPDFMEHFRCAIESRDDLPKLENLKIKIVEEFEARKERDNYNTSGAMIVNKKKFSYNKKSHNQKFQFKCHGCGIIGHKRSECRKQNYHNSKNDKKSFNLLSEHEKNSELEHVGYINENFKPKSNIWCLDSGSTSHMCADHTKLSNHEETTDVINLANHMTSEIRGKGDVKMIVGTGKNINEVILKHSLYVPDLRMNLMSVSKLTDNGCTVEFQRNVAKIIKNGVTIFVAERINNLYVIKEQKENAQILNENSKLKLWHHRLGHINERTLLEMENYGVVKGLDIGSERKLQTCETCIKGKLSQKPFPRKSERISENVLNIIHSDICGPMRVQSLGGSRYFITFIDDKSRWCEVKFLRNKNDCFGAFKEYKNFVEKQTGNKIKFLQSDNGKEYCNKEFDNYLKENGIARRLTVSYTPQQNGIAERKNRTLLEMARCLLIQSGLAPRFWAEAISTANYIRNRCLSKSLDLETPFEAWNGKQPVVSYFRTFGEEGMVLDKTPGKGKFQERTKKCIFIGYSEVSKAYKFWCWKENRVVISRDAKFLSKFPENNKYEEIYDEQKKTLQTENQESVESEDDEISLVKIKENESKNLEIGIEEIGRGEPDENSVNEDSPYEEQQREIEVEMKKGRGRPSIIRTGKVGRPKKQFNLVEKKPEEQTSAAEINIREALNSKDSEEWKQAICEEYISMLKNDTWQIVNLPENRKEIGCRLILTNKYNLDGSIERRKARLVAKGYSQEYGVDYNKTFAPVVRLKSVRLIMALAAQFNLSIHHIDIKTAYLNGNIDEEIYMKMPEQFEKSLNEIIKYSKEDKKIKEKALEWLGEVKKNERKTCLLLKSIYGLKQSGRQWNKKLDNTLKELNLKQLKTDPCIYFNQEGNQIIIVSIFVDDIIIASNNIENINRFKITLNNKVEVKDLGRIKHCLGIEFTQTEKGEVIMSQKHYIEDLLSRFGMENSNPLKTPLETNLKLQKAKSNSENMGEYPYQNLIGSLMYLAVGTRPDICYAVNYLSQFNTCYAKEHWLAAKRILRYLKGTMDYRIKYSQTNQSLLGYADADWASCVVDRRSYTGYTFVLAGAPISWEARKQRTVALSSTEAEYMALVEAAKEAIYLQNLLQELDIGGTKIKIYCDNMGAGLLAENNMFHARTKHIDVRHHFIREVIDTGKIEVEYIPTQEMTADILTKSLTCSKHVSCVNKMHLRE